MFKEIVELQNEFNKKVHPNWIEQNYNWNSAIIVESGELLESYGYKWWKSQEQAIENVKVEAIDLLHFVISDYMQQQYNDYHKEFEHGFDFYTDDTFDECRICFSYHDEQQHDMLELIDTLNQETDSRFSTMKSIFEHLNMSNEDVYLAYIIKNCLNEFRQKHGYKEGTYIKDWNAKEDNEVAYEIANEWGAEDLTYDQLMIDLEAYYISEVLK